MRLFAVVLLALASGCISPLSRLRVEQPIAAGTSSFLLRSNGDGPEEPERVARSIQRSVPQLAVWGGLDQRVTIHLLPTHGDLERAVWRPGFDWLRAWAQYDSIILQTPATWTSNDADLDELLVHELTHCLMWQHSADGSTWDAKKIPLWFREGMALWTAHQGQKYPALEEIASWMTSNPARDAFTDGDALSKEFYEHVYAIAHHAFTFLVRRYGEATVGAVMQAMRAGAIFKDAFEARVGLSTKQFQRDFENFVKLRGFRGAVVPVNQPRPHVRELLAPN